MGARALSHGSTLLLTLVAARVLGPADLGSFVLATALLALAMLPLYAGVYEYLLRADEAALHADAGFSVLLVTATAIAAAQWLLADAAGRWFDSRALPDLLRLFTAVPLLACLSAWREALLLRDPQRVAQYNAVLVLRDGLSLAVGLGGLALGAGLWALAWWRLSAALVGWLAWWRLCPRSPRWDGQADHWRAVLAYGGGITGTRLAKYLEVNGVDLLVGLLMHPAAVGLYRMASRLLVGVMDLLAQPLAKLNWVRVSEAARSGRPVHEESAAWHRLLLLLSWPVLTWIALSAPALATGVLGARWLAAAPVLTALAVAAMVRTATFSLEALFAVTGASVHLMRWRWASALAAMACVGLAPWGGMPLVTWSQVAVAVAGTLGTVHVATRHAGLAWRPWVNGLRWPMALSALLLGAHTVLQILSPPSTWSAAVLAVIAALGTAAAIWRQRPHLPQLGAVPSVGTRPTLAT